MTAALRHRGPDDDGGVALPEVSLGARRLAIIDIAGGRQPMWNEDHSIAVVFNGEIYNAQALRDDLVVRGHEFVTRCDTEVLPHLFEEYGDAFVDRLDGQFAIALWDARRQRLVLTRDRLGIRPLYCARSPGRFVFGSELKSVLIGLDRRPALNLEAVFHYLSLKYVPTPLTIYDDVRALRPGEQLVFQNRRCTVRRYWNLEDVPETSLNDEDALAQLEDQIVSSVHRRMIADVPVGALLSGGLDSSLIVAIATELTGGPIQTFTLGYADDFAHKRSDVEAARRVARLFGTRHHEYVLTPDEFTADLPAVLQAFDEPFAGVVSPYFLCKLVARHVKVCLSGDGADELFGSYLAHRLAQPVHNVRTHGLRAAQVRPELLRPCQDDRARLQRFAGMPEWQWRAALGVFTDDEKADLLNPDFHAFTDLSTVDWLRDQFAACPHTDPQNRQQHFDCRGLLPDLVLRFNDRLSMAHSIETRVPFVGHELVHFASSLPGHLKIRDGVCKWLLKEAARRHLPTEIVDRPKEGFVPPVNEWQRAAFRPQIESTLRPARLAAHGLFKPGRVDHLLARYYAGQTDLQYKVWALYCFQLWYDHVAARAVDDRAAPAPAALTV